MKKLATLLTLCLLWGLLPLAAQTLPPDSLRQHLNNLFAQVHKNQVSAPYLAEYGTRLASLTGFVSAYLA